MFRLSLPTKTLLLELREAVRPAGLFRSRRSIEPLVEAIAAAGEPAALGDLLDLYFPASEQNRIAMAGAITRVLSLVPVGSLAALDTWLRQDTSELYSWRALEPSSYPSQLPGSVACLGTMHPNGRVRELALRQIAAEPGSRSFCFSLLRANDWVAPIRLRARSAIIERISVAAVDEVISALPLFQRLFGATRSDNTDLESLVNSVLLDQRSRPNFEAAFRHPDPAIRRYCLTVGLGARAVSGPHILRLAMRDEDLTIRRWAFREALADPADPSLSEILVVGAADHSSSIRRLVAESAPRELSAETARLLRALLADPAHAVRLAARESWLRTHSSPPIDEYRALLGNSAGPVGAILGLGETGTADDSKLIEPFLRHPLPRRRAAAVRALIQLGEASASVLLPAYLGDANVVAREALNGLRSRVGLLDGEAIWLAVRGNLPRRIRAIRLYRSFSKWIRLKYLLRSALHPPCVPVEVARSELALWQSTFNRSFPSLEPRVKAELADLVSAASDILEPQQIRALRFALETQ